MPRKSSTLDEAVMLIQILTRIPKGRLITAQQLKQELDAAGIPIRIRTLQRYLKTTSVLVAADAISNLSESPALATKSFIANSAIGLRQMFPWQMKSTFVMSKYFLISYHFEFCTYACKIQFCFKNSRSTSSGRGVWFGYFSRSGAAAPSIM